MHPSSEPLPVENLEGLLSNTIGNNFQIKNVEWRPLTDPGENFGSIILAVNATISRTNKTETLNLVVKLPPKSAYLLDLFNSPVTFKKELHFYSYIATEMTNFQIECGIPKENVNILAPKYLGGRLGLRNPEEFDEQAAIVLENLKYTGYTTEDRIWGLGKRHTERAVEELAKLHAITIGLKMKKPQFFQNVMLGILQAAVGETAEKCVIGMIRKAHENLKNIPEARLYLDSVNKTIEYGIEMRARADKAEEPWATLLHNDFWVNNMMFRHNERGEPVDMKIVDFQLSMYDYGVKDLIFFLISSPTREVIDSSLNEMIDLYYDRFVGCLKTLKVDTEKFSKTKYLEIVNYCAPIKFNQCLMMTQVIQASRESAPEINQDMDGDDIFHCRAGEDIIRQKMLHIVSVFDKQRWLIN